jgi:hypothetical protein
VVYLDIRLKTENYIKIIEDIHFIK